MDKEVPAAQTNKLHGREKIPVQGDALNFVDFSRGPRT